MRVKFTFKNGKVRITERAERDSEGELLVNSAQALREGLRRAKKQDWDLLRVDEVK